MDWVWVTGIDQSIHQKHQNDRRPGISFRGVGHSACWMVALGEGTWAESGQPPPATMMSSYSRITVGVPY